MADVILEGAAGSIVILVNWALEMSTVQRCERGTDNRLRAAR
jgi:hypothetical protein